MHRVTSQVAWVLLLSACEGWLTPGVPDAAPAEESVPAECLSDELSVGWGPLRRVTHEEYDNSVRELTGTRSTPGRDFPPQPKSNGFSNGSALQTVGELQAEAYFEAAEALAAELLQPQQCEQVDRRCAMEFKLAAGNEQSVELRGTFRPDGWTVGEPMRRAGAAWVASVKVPWGASVQYKFFVNNRTWILDPANPMTAVLGGVTNSVVTNSGCAEWTCASPGWPTVLQCDAALGNDTCATRFISRFGARAFRRSLTSAEVAAYRQLVAAVSAEVGFNAGIQAVISAMLQSPHFLYHVERGVEVAPGIERLDADTMAARLATALWASLPDDALTAAAASGALGTREGVEVQARRMLADPRARPVLTRMFVELLRADELDRVPKDPRQYASWEDVRGSMSEETTRFIESVVFDGPGTASALFTARHTFVDGPLAAHYGLPPASGWQRVSLEGTPRLGVLTHGAVLATNARTNQSSPTLRGLFVRESLFCTQPPPPPQDANIVPPDPRPGSSTRERYAEHANNPACAGCHTLMDPIGLGFEHFDAVGRWRDTDEGHPVDATGQVFGTDVAGAFDGVEALAGKLARSRDVSACLGTQTFRFLTARHETDADRCGLRRLAQTAASEAGDLKELAINVVTSDAFRHRKVQP